MRAFAVCVAMMLLAPATASAAPSWLSPVNVSPTAVPGSNAVRPVVAVDAAGDAVALWGDDGASGDTAEVWAAVRPAGGSWQTPVQVYGADDPAWLGGFDLAVDAHGDALAVWEVYHCTAGSPEVCNYVPVQAAVGSAATGAWQAPTYLGEASSSTASGYAGAGAQVGLDSNGDAIVAWDHWDGSDYEVRATRRAGATGAWSAPVAISAQSPSQLSPQLAVDANGDAVAAFGSYAATLHAGTAAWTTPVDVATDGGAIAQLAIDDQGGAVAIWIGKHYDAYNNLQWVVYTATKPAEGDWQAPSMLSDGQTFPTDPWIAVDGTGDAAAVWDSTLGGTVVVDARTRPASTGRWDPVTEISDSAASYQMPDVIVDPAGDAVALWQQHSGGDTSDFTVQAAVHPASPVGLNWQPATTLSGALPTPGAGNRVTMLAADPQGDVIAGWYGGSFIQAAAYDGAGPRLDGVSIPSAGTAGQPLTFSVSPFDVWSAPSAGWTFGDGSSAAGTTVTHTFAAAGSYQVTVTGTDTAGNATTTSGTVTIAPASGTGPGGGTGATGQAPVIGRLAQSHRRWREGRRLAAIARRGRHHVSARRHRPPLGTVFSFTLDQQATVSLTFSQRQAGRRVKGRCVAQTRRNRHGRACTRTLKRGMLTLRGHAGANRLSFQGRLSRSRRLAPGRYAVQFAATNSAHQRSHQRSLAFTIVKG